jgi:hypothetical protein
MKNFTNKVAVITGAGGGIGTALALALAEQGCHLALADINQDKLDKLRMLLSKFNVNVSTHIVDVGNPKAYQIFVAEVIAQHHTVNLLINNAGISIQRSFSNHRIEDWQLIINVNLWGVINGCQYFLPYLKQADVAHIVNISSMAAFIGLPSQAGYCATKSAVRALSETLSAELAIDDIGVTCVHPGAIATNMIRNTLDMADDRKQALKNLAIVEKIALPVDKAARIILTAVQKKKLRVRVGKDSVLLDILKRLLPITLQKIIIRTMFKHELKQANH